MWQAFISLYIWHEESTGQQVNLSRKHFRKKNISLLGKKTTRLVCTLLESSNLHLKVLLGFLGKLNMWSSEKKKTSQTKTDRKVSGTMTTPCWTQKITTCSPGSMTFVAPAYTMMSKIAISAIFK